MTDAAAARNVRVLRASRLFSPLEPRQIAEFARSATRATYARGEHLWHAGAPAESFTIIVSGLVKISRTAPDGSEAILALFGPRESVGDVAVLRAGRYPADAIALSEVEVVRVDGVTVRSAFASNPAVLAAVNASLIEHAQALQEKIRIMSAGKVEKRLAMLLRHLAERFGDELDDGTTFVPVRVSRAECARLVGATVETTIRTFTRWQRQGIVETKPEGFAVRDLEALRKISGE